MEGDFDFAICNGRREKAKRLSLIAFSFVEGRKTHFVRRDCCGSVKGISHVVAKSRRSARDIVEQETQYSNGLRVGLRGYLVESLPHRTAAGALAEELRLGARGKRAKTGPVWDPRPLHLVSRGAFRDIHRAQA